MISEIVELAQIPAPTFREEARRAWVERRLQAAPGRVERDEVGNLVWRWGRGPLRLLLLAHLDTVFPQETPLDVKRTDGVLVGPGVGDNAAAVIVALTAVEQALTRAPALAAGALVFTVGEEGLGNLRGAHAACEQLPAAAVVAVEGHGLEKVIVDAVGSVRVRVTVTGSGGHSWVDCGSPSAVHALFDLGKELLEVDRKDAPVNIGLVEGGRSVNSIADRAALLVERRAIIEEPLEEFVRAAKALSVPLPLALEVEVVGRRPAGSLERDADLLRVLIEVRRELGLPLDLDAGSTDANAALARGIPAVTVGVGTGSGMHTLEERLEVDTLALGKRQLDLLLARLLSRSDTQEAT